MFLIFCHFYTTQPPPHPLHELWYYSGGGAFGMDMKCCYGLWCYPCALGEVAGFANAPPGQYSDQGQCCMYCCGWWCAYSCCGPLAAFLSCNVRQSLENRLARTNPGMAMPNGAQDCCCHLCCPCFAVSQELRAIQAFKERVGMGSPEIAEMER